MVENAKIGKSLGLLKLKPCLNIRPSPAELAHGVVVGRTDHRLSLQLAIDILTISI